LNSQAATLNIGANSLLIVPAGFNPATAFAHYSNAGIVHVAGTTLTIVSGQTISGSATIGDHVNCQGTLGAGNLNGGLTMSGTANVTVENLRTNDAISGMSGGTLSFGNHYVGYSGTGVFTQTGGVANGSDANGSLYLGYNAGDNGTYNLSGTGYLSGEPEHIGYSGTGTFNQSAGTNSAAFELGSNVGASGTYNLSGTGTVTAGYYEKIGVSGTGVSTTPGATAPTT
jgi:hypothetical protein